MINQTCGMQMLQPHRRAVTHRKCHLHDLGPCVCHTLNHAVASSLRQLLQLVRHCVKMLLKVPC